jgi:chitinase
LPKIRLLYTGDGNFKVDNIDPFLCTDLVYSFAVLNGSTYTIQIYDPWVDIDNNGYANFLALKTRNPQLKTTIAIGGWGDSHDGTKYSDMVASSTNRKTFVDSVVAFLQLYEFDGLDLDWEYPSGESDKAGFAELLKELRVALGTKLLSVAVAANSTIIDEGISLI